MTQWNIRRKMATAGLLAVLLMMPVARGRCLASTISQPAVRFFQYLQQSETAQRLDAKRVGLWERVLYSLILTGSSPEGKPATS